MEIFLLRQHSFRLREARAYTVLELLAVLAVIAILAAVTFGVATTLQQRSMADRARAELAMLAAALEQYRMQYGDYPWVEFSGGPQTGGEVLFNALLGRRGPRGATILGREFIETARLSTDNTNFPEPGDSRQISNSFLDPWGRPYEYFYRNSGSAWVNPSFVLYSRGPGGLHQPPEANGRFDDSHQNNRDNLYAGTN